MQVTPYLLHKQLRDQKKLDPNTSQKQCLFGLHLLDKVTSDTVVCIVESEKTAIICAVAMPQFVWLATGSEGNFSLVEEAKSILRKCKKVVVFPDAGSKTKWEKQVKDMALDEDVNLEFSNKCEGHPHNTDLADLIIYEWMTKGEKITPLTETPKEQPIQPTPTETTPAEQQTAKIVKIRKVPLFPEPYSYNWPYEYGLTDNL